ncbi:M23 family metallopeptidase [Streptomyces sp. NPDC051940]|uniref:murein hydrolase activator EnvC family protein n=1 Tax=Streptomyces sp. NPDC051940 TaxID=3155675 RepID=UPI00343620C8
MALALALAWAGGPAAAGPVGPPRAGAEGVRGGDSGGVARVEHVRGVTRVGLARGRAEGRATAAPGPGDRIGSPGDRAWPVTGPTGRRPVILRGYDPPATPYGAGHRGVDLRTTPGTPVRAAAAGTVTFAGLVAGRGVVSITLAASGDPPLRTTYEPVTPTTKKGDRVNAGDLVGHIQPTNSHCPTPCLHWGLRRADTYLNPLSLLPHALLHRTPSRLLPVTGIPVGTRRHTPGTRR